MKKVILIALAFCFTSIISQATHLMGGDVTVYKNASGTYVIKHIAYRDVLGVAAHLEVEYLVEQFDPTSLQWVNIYSTFGSSTLLLDPSSTTQLVGIPYGVEYSVYYDSSATINSIFAAQGSGRYRIITFDCCRNHAILNLTNPGSDGLTLTCEYEYDSIPTYQNSSPEFLALPVIYGPIHQPWVYNPLPYDADGDSLAWSLAVPQDLDSVLLTTNPCNGYVTPPSDATGPFNLNSINGELTWTPSNIGNYVASFQIDEYRNGSKIGSTIRDMQYVVIPDSLADSTAMVLPRFNNNNSYNTATSASGEKYNFIVYTPNMPLSFYVTASDDNSAEQLTLSATSELLKTNTFNASFVSTSTGIGNEKKGIFTWTPNSTDKKDFLLSIRANDGTFNKDITIVLKPYSPLAINTINQLNNVVIAPNPISNTQGLQINIDNSQLLKNCIFQIFDATGKEVNHFSLNDIIEGQHVFKLNTNLSKGFYSLKIIHQNGQLPVQKFMVQ
jgi:hypothetical protein